MGKHYIIKIIDENLASPTCGASLIINNNYEKTASQLGEAVSDINNTDEIKKRMEDIIKK